jgi:uncharacterized protein (TIGR00369 family)
MSHVLHDESDPVSGRVRLPAETGAPLPGLPGLLGIELRSASVDAAEAMLLVSGNHLAATGYLHAGCVVTLADTVCGYGCLAALPSRAAGFTTIELTSNHLSSAAAGHQLRAVATPLHLGRTTQVWDAKVTASSPGAEPKLISVFRCTQLILSQAP